MDNRNITEERWISIPNFPLYEISSKARVRRLVTKTCTKAGRILKASKHHNGYFIHGLMQDGKLKTRLLNRLVCESFHGAPPSKHHHAAHLDGNCVNNEPDNLAWKTARENDQDKDRHGTRARGARVHGILSEDAVIEIKAARRRGVAYKELIVRFGVTSGMIGHIMNGRAWNHIP